MLHGVRNKVTFTEALSLDGNIANSWRHWKQRFEMFSLASELSGKDVKIQVTTFLHVAGTEALDIYITFTWESDTFTHLSYSITAKTIDPKIAQPRLQA